MGNGYDRQNLGVQIDKGTKNKFFIDFIYLDVDVKQVTNSFVKK